VKSEINAKFNAFMDAFLYYFDIVFLLILINVRELERNSWITKGTTIFSKKKMQLLNKSEV
jgi:hypothetical protein